MELPNSVFFELKKLLISCNDINLFNSIVKFNSNSSFDILIYPKKLQSITLPSCCHIINETSTEIKIKVDRFKFIDILKIVCHLNCLENNPTIYEKENFINFHNKVFQNSIVSFQKHFQQFNNCEILPLNINELNNSDQEFQNHIKNVKLNIDIAFNEKFFNKPSDFIEINSQSLTNNVLVFEFLRRKRERKMKLQAQMIGNNVADSIFVCYNYARICRVLNKIISDCECIKIDNFIPDEIGNDFINDEFWFLIWGEIDSFSDMISSILQKNGDKYNYQIYKMCVYLIKLTRHFSLFYNRVKILIKTSNANDNLRISICYNLLLALRNIYEICFSVLGMSPVQIL